MLLCVELRFIFGFIDLLSVLLYEALTTVNCDDDADASYTSFAPFSRPSRYSVQLAWMDGVDCSVLRFFFRFPQNLQK